MEYEAECCGTLAQLLDVPDRAFAAHVAFATDPALMPPVVTGHVALFAERVGDLSIDERQELFTETFADAAINAERCRLVTGLRSGQCGRQGLDPLVEHLGNTLLLNRNPYAHLLVAIGALLRSAEASSR